MPAPSRRDVGIAIVSAVIAVGATLLVVNRSDDSVALRTPGAEGEEPMLVPDAATTTLLVPSGLAVPTAVRTSMPVGADGCTDATDPPLTGPVVGLMTVDGAEEVSLDGTRRSRIDGPAGPFTAPRWSGDHRFVAFNVGSWQDEPRPSVGIAEIATHCWRLWPRGSDSRRDPSISHDGSMIAYTVGAKGSTMIEDGHAELARADASSAVRLGDRLMSAAWAPDGRLAFSDSEGLKVRAPNGQTTLLHEARDTEFASWSPDHTRLAYTLSTNAGVWVAQADGSGHQKLVDGVAEIFFMSWSPDGTEIAYQRGDQVWIVPARGGVSRPVDGSTGVTSYPFWSPDGSELIFTTGDASGQGAAQVLAVPAAGGPPRLVADGAVAVTVFERA